ncbi:acylneuraminate cytidylyltransferase family protein [Candidatus Nucleicultrix amoebiphila]|jgi:CMP-N-acetylneuraminic acid synthetase|uniref:Acylneuraminate cytidylyltransferase n=1 Tax=Candidatus Nucleicultrix amoebiphila FS5 TaxID=1414854 RepID=A0A1W6N5C9_9PROT|nr:acylneuraminate cytidylyltransferase family protein [Candidatus Nucleicultrix amoebiphila]ARN85057.1 hypothetical protein GQ61_06870 [Candidatus Nucleicultrix amoebiphila FS5]
MNDSKILALITARAGSKRLPGKNTRDLGGLPLISWTIRAAQKSKYISKLILSSDDPKAIEIAKSENCEVPFLRPSSLSDDHSTSYDVAEHALKSMNMKYDWLVLLQPTSPFRSSEDIDSAIALSLNENADSVISVSEVDKSHLMLFMRNSNGRLESPYGISLKDLNNSRSQDLPIPYEINGALYVVKTSWFLERKTFFDESTISMVMPKERSVNIDTEMDWRLAEMYLKNIIGVKK